MPVLQSGEPRHEPARLSRRRFARRMPLPALRVLRPSIRRSKAPASFRGAKPENPLEPRYRTLRVAAEEIIVPGHLDDVGDVNQASDESERKAARDRERDPIRQAAFR